MKSARQVTLLYRQAHWPVPRMVGELSIRQFLFNRAIASMLPPYYTAPARAQVGRLVQANVCALWGCGMYWLLSHVGSCVLLVQGSPAAGPKGAGHV